MSFKKRDCDDGKKHETSLVQIDSAAPLSADNHKKATLEEIAFVQNLIERCLVLYMTKDEATTMLVKRAKIAQDFIHHVWQNLEEENPEFFKAYEIRVELKKHIITYNQLLEKQCSLMNSERYAMQQSLDYGQNNMPVNPSIRFPAEQPYLRSMDCVPYMHPLCNGSLNHMINKVPMVRNFYLNKPNG